MRIRIEKHPEEIIDVKPEVIKEFKRKLKEEVTLTEEEIKKNEDQDFIER